MAKSKSNPQPRKTVLYVRVSTDQQAAEGHSLEVQQARLEALAASQGRTVDEILVDDGFSAKNLKRPRMKALLEAVKAREIEAVYITKLDRLARSTRDLLDLIELFEKHDVALISASESIDTKSAMGKFVLTLFGSLAELERNRTSERTCEVAKARRDMKKVYCNVPFGFERVGDALIEVPSEIEAIKVMKSMATEGHSLRKIASHLEQQGIKPKQGASKWYAQTVKDVLTSKMTASIS